AAEWRSCGHFSTDGFLPPIPSGGFVTPTFLNFFFLFFIFFYFSVHLFKFGPMECHHVSSFSTTYLFYHFSISSKIHKNSSGLRKIPEKSPNAQKIMKNLVGT